jgi:hypothetical protein
MPDVDEGIKKIGEAVDKLFESIRQQGLLGHASVVIRFSAILEEDLEQAITLKMRPLSKHMQERLFGDYGPISSFAAKIDIAFALDITTTEIHEELHKIRRIRNEIAHSKTTANLEIEAIRPLFDALRKPPTTKTKPLEIFAECAIAINEYLERFMVRMGVTENLSLFARKMEG